MSSPYKEIFEGQIFLRAAPGPRHELICGRLHAFIHASVANLSSASLLSPRSEVKLSASTIVCPDLALVTRATGKLWLAAEIINSGDHQPDTVIKKEIYEGAKLPRLWMIDPRYDNVETYHGSEYGLMLKAILIGGESLAEKLIPEFHVTVSELFAG
jgi:hypothetical protein